MPMIFLLGLTILMATPSLRRGSSTGMLITSWAAMLRLILGRPLKIVEISVVIPYRNDRWSGHHQQGFPLLQFNAIQINDCTERLVPLT